MNVINNFTQDSDTLTESQVYSRTMIITKQYNSPNIWWHRLSKLRVSKLEYTELKSTKLINSKYLVLSQAPKNLHYLSINNQGIK